MQMLHDHPYHLKTAPIFLIITLAKVPNLSSLTIQKTAIEARDASLIIFLRTLVSWSPSLRQMMCVTTWIPVSAMRLAKPVFIFLVSSSELVNPGCKG